MGPELTEPRVLYSCTLKLCRIRCKLSQALKLPLSGALVTWLHAWRRMKIQVTLTKRREVARGVTNSGCCMQS